MDVFLNQLFVGLSIASILLLVALGLTFTFGQMNVINMAHGEFIMAGAYTTYVLQTALGTGAIGLAFGLALPAAFLVAGTLGLILEFLVIRRLYGRPLDTLLVTWGVGLMLQQLARDLFGAQNVNVDAPGFLDGGITIAGADLSYPRLFIITVVVARRDRDRDLHERTPAGRRMRAVMQNRPLASVSGVRTTRVDRTTFFIGSGLAGLAGVGITLLGPVGPTLGLGYIIDAFLVVIVGGLGQLRGAIIAALALGMANSFIEYNTSTSIAKAGVFLLIVLFLQWRPQGMIVQQAARAGVTPMATLAKLLPSQRADAVGRSLVRFALMAVTLLLIAPAVLSDFRLSLLAKFLCFAIIAIGIGLAWGQGGMLVLGQGLFFGLGGYCMGMHMKIVDAGPGNLPDILTYSGQYESLPCAVEAVQLAPGSRPDGDPAADGDRRAARRRGLSPAHSRRVLRDPQPGAGGGVRDRHRRQPVADRRHERADELPDLLRPVGRSTRPTSGSSTSSSRSSCCSSSWRRARSCSARYGRLLIASRDDEDRVRFLGYDPARIKLVAYVLAAGMAGLAGALFVPVVGIISPALLGIVPSIEMVIWVALGGRTALAWAAAGAVIVN